ncbi:MAG: hypothetical protein L6R42_004813 [Xanthoria sp. 1 TBL-2021]|nr:MAG: hypothetical protein L6R42_004813 [Xanthoria sp. 1 TBL-2021]
MVLRKQLTTRTWKKNRSDFRYNFKATNLKNIYRNKDFSDSLVKDINPSIETQKPKLTAEYLHMLCRGAPKIRALLRNIRDKMIRDEE